MRKITGNNYFTEQMLLPIGFLLAVLFLLLNFVPFLLPIRSGISFLFEPISANAIETSSKIKGFFNSFVNIGDISKENAELKLAMYEKDINNAYYLTLKEENDSLRKQIALGNMEDKYALAKNLGTQSVGYIKLDVGTRDHIIKGDIVSLGNILVGVIERADLEGSLLVLPIAKGSNFECIVTSVGVESAKVSEQLLVISKAVATGMGDYIKIENISKNSTAKDGDIVVVTDSKVGRYLILGKLVNLSNNPAETSKSALVSPLIDYENVMNMFVRIN